MQHLATHANPMVSTEMEVPEKTGQAVRNRRRKEPSNDSGEGGAKAEVVRLRAVNQKLREIIKTLADMQAL